MSRRSRASDYRANPALVKELVENAPETVTWLESIGMKFKDTRSIRSTGSLYPRGHAPLGSLGQDYIKVLVDQCKKYGIPIEKQARVVRIIRETPLKGKVLGVEYEKRRQAHHGSRD